jgi:hypothetical protein
MPVIPALGRLENCKFKAHLGYTEGLCLKKKETKIKK